MNWFKVEIAQVNGPPFTEAEDDELGTWLRLYAYCAEQENGGRIAGAKRMSARAMMRALGVDAETLQQSPETLWRWDGDDLLIEGYNHAQEEKCRSLRERAATGGKAKGKAYAKASAKAGGSTDKRRGDKSRVEENPSPPSEDRGAEPKKSPKTSKEGLEFADWFRSTLPAKTQLKRNWRDDFAKTFDDLVRLDERTPEEIRRVSSWAREDEFWSGNFMSPTKLRKRNGDGIRYFDVFAAKMKQESSQQPKKDWTEML